MAKINRRILLVFFMVFMIGVFLGFNLLKTDRNTEFGGMVNRIELNTLSEEMKQSLFSGIDKEDFHLELQVIPERISQSTPLVLLTEYTDTGRKERQIIPMPGAFQGQMVTQLRSQLTGWDIQDYQPETGLILYREKDELISVTSALQLGILEEKVGIFYDEGNRSTDIDVDRLPSFERDRLKEGIEINNQEELLTILEGFRSYEQD